MLKSQQTEVKEFTEQLSGPSWTQVVPRYGGCYVFNKSIDV